MAHIHSVYDNDTHFKIDATTRAVKNASETKTMLVQHDHNSERFTFEIPRIIDGHDMSTCNVVQIHYINIDAKNREQQSAGIYQVEDLQISPESDDVVILSWLISANATKYVGSLNFIIRFVCSTYSSVDYAWNTAVHSGVFVTAGILNDYILSDYVPDILEQWRTELIPHIGENGNWYVGSKDTGVKAQGDKGNKGDKGDTPYILDGYWYIGGTNTGVPAQGDKGDPFTYDDFTAEQLAALKGDQGDTPYIQNGYWYIGGKSTGVKAQCEFSKEQRRQARMDALLAAGLYEARIESYGGLYLLPFLNGIDEIYGFEVTFPYRYDASGDKLNLRLEIDDAHGQFLSVQSSQGGFDTGGGYATDTESWPEYSIDDIYDGETWYIDPGLLYVSSGDQVYVKRIEIGDDY